MAVRGLNESIVSDWVKITCLFNLSLKFGVEVYDNRVQIHVFGIYNDILGVFKLKDSYPWKAWTVLTLNIMQAQSLIL